MGSNPVLHFQTAATPSRKTGRPGVKPWPTSPLSPSTSRRRASRRPRRSWRFRWPPRWPRRSGSCSPPGPQDQEGPTRARASTPGTTASQARYFLTCPIKMPSKRSHTITKVKQFYLKNYFLSWLLQYLLQAR